MRNATVRKPPRPSPRREESTASGGVTAVTRALMLMEAFHVGEPSLALAELSRRTGMHKTTVLRLARTLALSGYMVQREDGAWRLGRPPAGWARATRPASTSTTWWSRRCGT